MSKPDFSRVGAVSDERAAEQLAEVERVYADKSETPISRTDWLCSLSIHQNVHPSLWREMAALEKETVRLRAFAQDIMTRWPDGDVDGGDLQESAIKYGLLELKVPPPSEPCHPECNCAGYFTDEEWKRGEIICYRKTALLSPASTAGRAGK